MNKLDKVGLEVRAEFIKDFIDAGKKAEVIQMMDDERTLQFINAMCQTIADHRKTTYKDLMLEGQKVVEEIEKEMI
jgi:hypothetical protein